MTVRVDRARAPISVIRGKMIFVFFLTLLGFCVCESEEGDLGYGLNIGNAIDIFANYGDLSQVTQVISAEYEGENGLEPTVPFNEKNIKVFYNASSMTSIGTGMTDLEVRLCETVDDLLVAYFNGFKIEGTDRPWKAFMGDWVMEEIMRTFAIEYDSKRDNCCYVLIKLAKTYKTSDLDDLSNVYVKDYVTKAVNQLNISDTAEVRQFMKSYGTHYIESYVTGNFIYQVFKYKRTGFNMLRSYVRRRSHHPSSPDNLRFYFSSYFLRQVGDIKVASGNKTVENWARWNLRDSQYLYSRPSILRLHYNPLLVIKLNELMDNNALLGLTLKTLRPMFLDRRKGEKFAEAVDNDLKLWEVNG